MGRSTEYCQELQDRADLYLSENERPIPSVAGLAVYLNIARSTVYKWADENDDFSDTLEQILAEQELEALNKGLTGDFNATITKLVLANHGYADKQATEISGPGGGPVDTAVTFVGVRSAN